VTVLLIVLAVIAFFGWLYSQRKSGTGLPTGTNVYDDAGRHDLDRLLPNVIADRRHKPEVRRWSCC
jgi:hypothetical protein